MATKKITALNELTTVADEDVVAIVEDSAGETKKVTAANLQDYILKNDGWINASETWTYVSVDDPTGVIKTNADVTTKYSLGMRIKMTNGGNTIYGIITKIGTYGGDAAGYTYLTFLHEIDPTDSLALYLMANSAITANYYSLMKVPFGFPLSKDKWQVILSENANRSVSSPTENTWYNVGSLSLSVPIGDWKISYSAVVQTNASVSGAVGALITLSSSNSSESDIKYTCYFITSDVLYMNVFGSKERNLTLSSKTKYYLLLRTPVSLTSFRVGGNNLSNTTIKAECNYL